MKHFKVYILLRRKEVAAFSILLILLFYLYFGIGLCGDDYYFVNLIVNTDFRTVISSLFNGYYLLIIPGLFYYFIILKIVSVFNTTFYSIWLTVTAFTVLYFVYIFMCDYTTSSKALLFSFLFFFYPTHDATAFWLLGMYIPINVGIFMYAHHYINAGKYYRGFIISLFGAFYGYSSPAIGIGLSSIFLMKKRVKKFMIFLIPNLVYIIYGMTAVKEKIDLESWKFANIHNPLGIIKQLVVQICTAIDTFLGPSFFLKIYYALPQLSLFSIFIGSIILMLFIRVYDQEINSQKTDNHLMWGFVIVAFLSFVQLSITGKYPQIAFNLGNRVTSYGSLFMALAILHFISKGKKIGVIIFAVFLFTVLGISDHWKEWNREQEKIINRISTNRDIEALEPTAVVFVSHNQYSKYGPFSHIEFFSSSSREIFATATKSSHPVLPFYPICKRFRMENEYLVDGKFASRFKVENYIYVYNSCTNKLEKIEKERIQSYIDDLPDDKRHWIQFVKYQWIRNAILKLSPNLKYLLAPS